MQPTPATGLGSGRGICHAAGWTFARGAGLQPGSWPFRQTPFRIDDLDFGKSRTVPAPKRDAGAPGRHEGRIDDAVKPQSHQPSPEGVGRRQPPGIQVGPPFASMYGFFNIEFRECGGIVKVRQSCTLQPQLSDQGRVLDEPLIVFGPCSRQFERSVDGRRSDGIPAPAKTRRSLPGKRCMGPARHISPPQHQRGRTGVRHRRRNAPLPDRREPCPPCPRPPGHRRSCRPIPGWADA